MSDHPVSDELTAELAVLRTRATQAVTVAKAWADVPAEVLAALVQCAPLAELVAALDEIEIETRGAEGR